MVQVSIENLTEEKRNNLESWLAKNRLSRVSWDTPTESLESFFLRVVKQAREERISTAGAEKGKQVKDFFSDAPQNLVIEQLLHPKKASDTHVERKNVEQEKDAEQKKKDNVVLENLLFAEKEKNAEKKEEKKEDTEASLDLKKLEKPKVSDKGKLLLDQLTKKKD